ncbi:Protein WVD2-like 7 [Camellia lanceoleosa]|uniref:Protein WVD2-like 7 n=1 Tax=Camellia lanceoleosa TaxID=1840588 RepID=A0ACC0IPN2_9ERIC|nr:Protein WVD2-like 7 [Camellia lanceoleosa]
MGESPTCLVRSFSQPAGTTSTEPEEGDPYCALTTSISFRRFMLESLACEKWSCFSNNQYLEEAKKSSKPGLVAQRKAYFEALYKRNGAKKPAALLEEQNAASNEPNVMEETSRDSSNPQRIPAGASGNGLSVHSSAAPQEERRRSKPVDDCSVSRRIARPPTVPSSFSLRCEERAAKRKEFFQKLEEKTNAKILVSGRRIADGKSHGIDHLKTSGVSGPKARPPTIPSSFSLRCEERAAKRKEFFQKLEEKTNAKEADKVHLQAKNKISLTQPMHVKMKLVNLGHAQSEETRMKIGNGVRMGWERRHEKLKLQETCYFEWQDLIAEASRKGLAGEEEKQWDSYKILDEQLEQEWLESVEQRRKMARPKGSKRAPKPLEQRRKISETISAKWADPVRAYVAFSAENAYRDRICTALYKYHGTPVGAERKPKSRPSSERQPRTQNPTKKKTNDTDNSTGNVTESQKRRTRLRSNMPLFKDPLASSKLEMIKNIRAEKAAAENKKTEAIERAKLLIAEGENAAKALEAATTKSPLAQASLIETRNLIAKVIQSIEIGQIDSHGNGRHPSIALAELVNQAEKENNPGIQRLSQTDHREIKSPKQ